MSIRKTKISTAPAKINVGEVFVAENIPEFTEKESSWFKANYKKIRLLTQNEPWWQNHSLLIEQGQTINPLELSRLLSDFGYTRASGVRQKAEYSFTGGILSVSPVNEEFIFEIEFIGNYVESIRQSGKQVEKDLKFRDEMERTARAFKAGDFVVHADHGIGKLAGETTDLKNYYELHYAKGDKLFVPFSQSKKLSLYLGFAKPKVMRLGGNLWSKVTKRAREDVLVFARELLVHYKTRHNARGFSFAAGGELNEIIESFPYPETPDQGVAWHAIEQDMKSPEPMDRLLVGDVGFGKTELALRAAYLASLNGKQTALLAPTTILAWQHFKTFTERLGPYGVKVAMASRLQKPAEQKEILKKTTSGQTDILIGTHRLLSKDVAFKNLGLLIIDEEQRFGVRAKERLSMLKEGVDILMLSATPIPRTLSAALSGFKKISELRTAPLGREAINTYVEKFSYPKAIGAIKKELERKGQVFFLENRIGRQRLRIKELSLKLPQVSFGYLHGRMGEKEIVQTLEKFRAGDIGVLVATTIIENGIDLPNANTLIVADATRLGLAQAHQLRGRVGRAHQKASAWFFYPAGELTDQARSRLDALLRYAKLGDGLAIALEDLRLRGAGSVLGKKQSGHVNALGWHLYLEMLSETLNDLTNRHG